MPMDNIIVPSEYGVGTLITGPAMRPELDHDAERRANRITYDQVWKEFFVSPDVFAAVVDRPDFPRHVGTKFDLLGRRTLIFSRSAIAAWCDAQKQIAKTLK